MNASTQPDISSLDVSVVTTLEEFDEIASEWLAFLDDALPGDEMQHDPRLVRALLAERDAEPRFIVVRKYGRIQCIAPFFLQSSTIALRLSVMRLTSLPAKALRLLGDQVMVRRDQDPEDALRLVFRSLDALGKTFDVVGIDTQRIDAPLWSFLSSSPGRLAFRPVVVSPHHPKVHGLDFRGTFDEYLAVVRTKAGFPGKTIRRFWRDAKDGTSVLRVSEPSQVHAFLQSVDHVYNASWQGRTLGARRRDNDKEIARLTAIAELGFLRSYVLFENGTATAFVLGYQYRGRYSYVETCYDSSRSVVSPGSVLTHAVIEDLFRSERPRELDFGFGDHAYKRIFGNTSSDVCSVYIVRQDRWRVVLGIQQALNAAYEGVRAVVTRAGLEGRVRRLLKRQRPVSSSASCWPTTCITWHWLEDTLYGTLYWI